MADNFYKDNDDLRFYMERGLDWAELVELTEVGFRGAKDRGGFQSAEEALAFYKQVAETVGEFVAGEVAPHVAEVDREGVRFEGGEAVFPPRLAGIFDKIKELDLHGMCLPRELGGLNLPLLVYMINAEIFARADVSVMAHHGFHGGMAMAMLLFSIQEGSTTVDRATGEIRDTRFRAYIDEIIRGEAWGCMDITESDAGSDMAKLRTRAEQDDAGNWFVSGQKIFITSGHGKYHFVIARTEAPKDESDPFSGLAGLSMFLVPTYEEKDGVRRRIVAIERLEEKLGHHGSATATLNFERAPAQLIGKRGEGFKYMLTLMNGARVSVGFESIGLCESAYRAALAYAEERGSMGKKIARHEMIADYLDEMRTDVQALRALAMYGAFHDEMDKKLALAKVVDAAGDPRLAPAALERRTREHKRKARRVTPLLKYLASEKAVEMARRCVQIHGGNGYTKDYPGEKLLRDAIVFPIYEGTSQIQSLMAMKDTLGAILKSPQAFVRRQAQARWRALSSTDPLERKVARLQIVSMSAQQHLTTRTATDKLRTLADKPVTAWARELTKSWDPKRDFALAMLHAERLTRILADEAIAEILLEQARKFPERRELLERFLERAEPRARFLLEEITTTGERLLGALASNPESTRPSHGRAAE